MNQYTLDDIKPGLAHAFTVEITDSMVRQFTALTGDCNPLHTDPDFARAQGFPTSVVYGMLTASFYSTLVGVHLPGKYALLQGVDATFHRPVFSGDVLTIQGCVTCVHESVRQIEIKALITNQNDQKVSQAKIKVGINA